MDDALTCGICTEIFSAGDHDPLVLQCGHYFCRSCLQNINDKKAFACPSCRAVDKVNVNNLPIIYKLLNLATEPTEPKYSICQAHADTVSYYCETCHLALCGLCLFSNHSQSHKVIKGEAFLRGKQRFLESRFEKWKKTAESSKANKTGKLLNEVRNLCLSQANFVESEKAISKLLKDIPTEFDLDIYQDLEAKINSLMTADEPSECSTEINEVTQDIKDGPSFKATEQDSSLYCIKNYDGQIAPLEWQDGKILLLAFREMSDTYKPLLKVPHQVFLELSIKDKYLGRVIIQPWYQLRRAQQFAALCLVFQIMEEALACAICTELFSSGDHDPLVLKCGHCFCRSCLRIITTRDEYNCPSCGAPEEFDVESLPINCKLLGPATEPIEPKYAICQAHSDIMRYYCETCHLALCGLCLFINHSQSHKVIKGEAFLQGKKCLLESSLNTGRKPSILVMQTQREIC